MTSYPQNTVVTIELAGILDETARLISAGKRLKPYNVRGDISRVPVSTTKKDLNTILKEGLKFPHCDFAYGMQDTLQADYNEMSPMGAPEGYHAFNRTQNRVIEFMLKLFCESEEDIEENHNIYWALQSLVLPWIDSSFTLVLPPPKVRLIVSDNVYATGFFNSLTTTHYDPVSEQYVDEIKGSIKVLEYIEIVCSFTRQALLGLALPYGNFVGGDGHSLGFGTVKKRG